MRDDAPIRLGPYVFTNHSYDESSDVLYLSIGSPREAIVLESPEGHLVRLRGKSSGSPSCTPISKPQENRFR